MHGVSHGHTQAVKHRHGYGIWVGHGHDNTSNFEEAGYGSD